MAAISEIVRHWEELRSKAFRLERSASDAEDLVQDTVERALRSWRRFTPGTNLRSWLLTIMHNLFLDRCRSRLRWGALLAEPPPCDAAMDAESVMPAAWEQVTLAEVHQLQLQLARPLREAFQLVAIEGLSYQQAAERLGIAPPTVGTRLLRARRQLRGKLARKLQPAVLPAAEPELPVVAPAPALVAAHA